jgi:hypothetical protein
LAEWNSFPLLFQFALFVSSIPQPPHFVNNFPLMPSVRGGGGRGALDAEKMGEEKPRENRGAKFTDKFD